MSRAEELAAAAAATLEHARFVIQDFSAAGEPVLGRVQLQEAEILDLSRDSRDDQVIGLQHSVVTLSGIANEL